MNKLISKTTKWAAVAAIGLFPLGAKAAVYDFAFTTADFTASGVLTTADVLDAVGGYDVTAISGTINGASMSLISNPSQPNPTNNGTWIYDNVLFLAPATPVDNPGILFTAGGYDYNVYSTASPLTYYLSTDNPAGAYNPGEVITSSSISAVPETSTWIMLLAGFAGLGVAGLCRSRYADVAPTAA